MEEVDRRREDEWFLQNEKELIERARREREKRERERAEREQAEDRERLRQLHYMCCPKCGHPMQEEDLVGVKVDRCTFCEGLFFDADELEQVLVRRTEDRRSFFRKLVGI